MLYLQNFKLPGRLVLLTILSVSGCSKSIEAVAARPQLPDLPAKLAAPCYEPGVASDAIRALSDTRVALASCRKGKADIAAFYKDVRKGMQ